MQANDHMSRGNVDGAIRVLQQALAENPDEEDAHALLAICLLDKKRVYAAHHEAQLALSLDSGSELANYAKAHVEIARRKFKEAEDHVEHLIQSNPINADYYRLKAHLFELTHRKQHMQLLLEKALSLDPEDPDTLASLSRYHLGSNDSQLAEQYALQALSIEPEHEASLVAMGYVLLEKNKTKEAKEHAISALQINPNDARALFLLSAIKTKSNLFLGLWWRYNSWMAKIGPTKAIFVLLVAFVCYRLGNLVATDLGRVDVANIINFGWLAIVIYTFVGPALFNKSLRKELQGVNLRDGF